MSSRQAQLEKELRSKLQEASAPEPPSDQFQHWLQACDSSYRQTQATIIKKAQQIVQMKKDLSDKRTFRYMQLPVRVLTPVDNVLFGIHQCICCCILTCKESG
jgi:transposase